MGIRTPQPVRCCSALGSLVPVLENLAHHYRGHGGEHGDAQSGERVLALGHSHGGDHPSAQGGKGQLLGDVVATAGRLLHALGTGLKRT